MEFPQFVRHRVHRTGVSSATTPTPSSLSAPLLEPIGGPVSVLEETISVLTQIKLCEEF